MRKLIPLVILAAASWAAFAQAPLVQTNLVRLDAKTLLDWDYTPTPENPDMPAGYIVRLSGAGSTTEHWVTNKPVAVLTLRTNMPNGVYVFSVMAVNQEGMRGEPGGVSTNLVRAPAMVLRLRFETKTTAEVVQ